jgi:hypothetical protein
LIEEALLKPSRSKRLLGGRYVGRTEANRCRASKAKDSGVAQHHVAAACDEIKELDADEAEIDMLARLAEAIMEKYLNRRTHPDEPIEASSVADETVHPEAPPEPVPPPNLDINQNVSPNFGSPLRRLVRR